MLAGIHFFSASALAFKFSPNYLVSFLIGFFLHHLEDFLPHLDLNLFGSEKLKSVKNWSKEVWILFVIEFLFFFFLTFYFLKNASFNQKILSLSGGLGALMPDIISFTLNSFFPNLKILNFYQKFHENFHFKLKQRSLFNYFIPFLVEAFIIVLSIYFFKG